VAWPLATLNVGSTSGIGEEATSERCEFMAGLTTPQSRVYDGCLDKVQSVQVDGRVGDRTATLLSHILASPSMPLFIRQIYRNS
jgi:hypothetical protein